MTTEIIDGVVFETIKCPDCGHDATFVHEVGQPFGVIRCDECDKRAADAWVDEAIKELSPRAHRIIEEADL